MSGDAFDTISRFWEVQDAGDYTATSELFAEDALFEDPIYGTFTGRSAIAEFMAKMNAVVGAQGGAFRATRIEGDDATAWAQWEYTSPDRTMSGVGIYRVADGHITYYRDYVDAEPTGQG